MQLSEAFEKATEEMGSRMHGALHDYQPLDEEGEFVLPTPEQLERGIAEIRKYTFDGTAREFIDQRSRRIAQEQINALGDDRIKTILHDPEGGAKLEEYLTQLFDELWIKDVLQLMAMGYSFNAPENHEVPRDKEGFLRLAREVDRDVTDALVVRFTADYLLTEKIKHRLQMATALISRMFSATGAMPTKRNLERFFRMIHAIGSLDCFIAGGKVRDLLEEEVAFEAMMKEMDE